MFLFVTVMKTTLTKLIFLRSTLTKEIQTSPQLIRSYSTDENDKANGMENGKAPRKSNLVHCCLSRPKQKHY
jgi:hypothetical protein